MRIPTFLMMLVSGCYPCAAQSQPVTVVHEFHIREGGDFFGKTIKEMGSREFEVLMKAACYATSLGCGDSSGTARAAFRLLSDEYISQGGNHYITGRVQRHEGEEWWGNFDTFAGYEVCRAGLDYGNMGISGGSTFNTVVDRNGPEHGLRFYAVVPKGRSSGQGIDAVLSITYVPVGTEQQYGCMADEAAAWLCKGQSCSPLTRMR